MWDILSVIIAEVGSQIGLDADQESINGKTVDNHVIDRQTIKYDTVDWQAIHHQTIGAFKPRNKPACLIRSQTKFCRVRNRKSEVVVDDNDRT